MGKKKKKKRVIRDKHYLYTAAVQSVDADLRFVQRVYKKARGRRLLRMREDFCGTAVLACEWVRRRRDHEAWGVDLDRKTLDWGDARYGKALGAARERLHLLCQDVRSVHEPPVDLVVAQNFSYSVFKTRADLGGYFRQVRRSMAPGGIFVLDAWGGTETMGEDLERRKIDGETAFDGTRLPSFNYIWEQKRFNPIDHHILCYIHFKLKDGTRINRAFTYDWRLWTLPELQELMIEAGFATTHVYLEGWDEEEDDTDGIFRRRTYFENQEGWVAYVVALA